MEIDYVDYEDGMVYVYFAARVSWKKPSVVVRDEDGNSYAAVVAETSRTDCSIEVSGLEGGRSYTFVLGGLTPAGKKEAVTVKGYFEKPEIAQEIEEDTDETEDGEEEKETTAEQKVEPEPDQPEASKSSEYESQETDSPLETESGSEETKQEPETAT